MPIEEMKWHFGVLSVSGTGHVNSLMSLSREIVRRGHRVTFFDKPKIESRVREAGFGFVPLCAPTVPAHKKPLANDTGIWPEISTLRFNLARVCRDSWGYLENTPPALVRAGVNALLIDEIALTGPTVAQLLRLPYFIISTSAPHYFGWGFASWFSGYRYSASCLSWMQGLFLELSVLRVRGPIRRSLDRYRRQVGLRPVGTIPREFPCLAHITQMPKCLDRPRRSLPSNFHYTGPFASRSDNSCIAFPWHRLDGRPIVYASLGTTRNVQPGIFLLIAAACQDLDVQLVISLGNRFDPKSMDDLPGQPLVTKYAPQLELLKLARIVITHGGSNTVFEALMEGKPMIVIPLAYEQPALAARLSRLHIAEALPVMRLSPKRIRAAVAKVLSDTSYGDAARAIQATMLRTRGSDCAADVIEDALRKHALKTEVKGPAEWLDPIHDQTADKSEALSCHAR